MFVFISYWFPIKVCIYKQNFFNAVTTKTPHTKRRSQKLKKRMSCERALNLDLLKILSENYKPMKVCLRVVCKFINNYCRSRLFSEFTQTHRRYPTIYVS